MITLSQIEAQYVKTYNVINEFNDVNKNIIDSFIALAHFSCFTLFRGLLILSGISEQYY